MRTIYKYQNRKLYDTSIKSYVTLNDVIRFEEPFTVVDHKTRNDITNDVKIQAMFSAAKNDVVFRDKLLELYNEV